MVLENTNPDLANIFGPNSPEVQQLNADSADPVFKGQETNDYVGVGVHVRPERLVLLDGSREEGQSNHPVR